MAISKLTEARLRYYVQEWDFTVAELAQMFALAIEEIDFRIARLKRDDARKALAEVPLLSPVEREAEQRVASASHAACRRPAPPEEMLTENTRLLFAPAFNLRDWMLNTFVAAGSPLYNEKHKHLAYANIGVLWTPVGNGKNNRRILGTAEKPFAQGNKWSKARAMFQLEQWFGEVPDFLITLDAHYATECDDWSFCALVEHEMLHCAQAVDEFGVPKIDEESGKPIFTIMGHDFEQFTNIVVRYGADVAGVQEMVEAAKRRPLLGRAKIAGACGTCLR